jgi:hypothetical protein
MPEKYLEVDHNHLLPNIKLVMCHMRKITGSIPKEVAGFFNVLILPAALSPWNRLSL